jgi:uncharacterized protein
MLEMRPGCECCDKDLPANLYGAYICSFECTFCSDCASEILGHICPNCGGTLIPRPLRTLEKLANSPASTVRTFNPNICKK